ncbi:MAG: molybdopterin biosynthesis protein [Desulfobulbaceae bacterium]
MKRNVYLKMKPLEEARDLFLEEFGNLLTAEEEIDSRFACGRVTSRPVTANFSAPSFHAAAMDGIAVSAADTFGAADDAPLTLRLDTGQAVMINTGHPLPEDKDAVIMIENVVIGEGGATATIRSPIYPWQNVRRLGEDIVATELLFPTHHLLGPADVGALLTAGCPTVMVRRKPKVLFLPTGNELVEPRGPDAGPPPSGKTIESNCSMLAALAGLAGAETDVAPIIRDDSATLSRELLAAIRSGADMVVVNAGSSAGSADYTARVIEELGQVLVHGITIMPGKPTILGKIEGKPVLGNPGYPVSALISFEQLAVPLLRRMQGLEQVRPLTIEAILGKSLPSRGGIEEFRRMITGRLGDRFVSVPLKKGAGAISTITRANTMLRIPASSEGESRGSLVKLELLRPLVQVERTILCTGSHDLTLDLLHDLLKKENPAYPLASTHVGSMGGIMAVREELTHLAGTHLLDPETGEYNVSYLRRYLGDMEAALITLVHREQGFMVRPGNPKNIREIDDLLRNDVVFINRQAGSGTRVLLDFELEKGGLDSSGIRGYDTEEYTHMAVAAAVLSGKADTGLGIRAAAGALRLDFIPVTEERYDLLIPLRFLELPGIRRLLEIIDTAAFRERVTALGGYSTRETGKRVL